MGQRIVFERNPDYQHGTGSENVPYLDKITWEVGQEPSVALLRLVRDEVDILGDGIPPAQFVEAVENPEYQEKGMIVEHPMIQTSYVTMNVRIPPFDNVLVRKAVNMAINKDRIVRLINNRAIPATQPLPPNMPGHDASFTGYAYDPAKAKELLAEAGYPDGFETELWNMNTDPNPRIAQAIQQDLAEVGINAALHSVASSVVIAAGGEEQQAPMIWSGGMAWISDYPDPSGFYWSILGCGGAVPGGWNWAWYCNEEVEAKAAKADAMADPAMAQERVDLWRSIYLEIMEDAPWVPDLPLSLFHVAFGPHGRRCSIVRIPNLHSDALRVSFCEGRNVGMIRRVEITACANRTDLSGLARANPDAPSSPCGTRRAPPREVRMQLMVRFS